MGVTSSSNDGRKRQDVAVEVDLESIERGGNDSITSDINANDALNVDGGGQKTISAIRSDTSSIEQAVRSSLWSLLASSKIFVETPTGDLILLQGDGEGNLKTTPVNPASSTATSTSVTVGTSSTTVLSSNSSRNYALVMNDSDEVIYLSLGAPATMNSGIRLNPNGGAFEISQINLFRGEINAICTSGSKNLVVVEW